MLPLPISPQDFVSQVVAPALEHLPKHMDSVKARVMLVAICLQESALKSRWQILNDGGKGPARGLAQFERGTKSSKGGVWGVYLHSASTEMLRQLCRDRDVNFEPFAIWAQLERDDVLAVAIARLMLWTVPTKLPEVTDVDGAWLYYLSSWRPGKPHSHTWAANHAKAVEAVC